MPVPVLRSVVTCSRLAEAIGALVFVLFFTLFGSLSAHAQQAPGELLSRERPAPERLLEPAKPEPVITKPGMKLPQLNLESQNENAGESSMISPTDIPAPLLEEMNTIERQCVNNTLYAAYHDCRCIAIKFLDARLKSDPVKNTMDSIFQRVANECPNTPGIAGYIYSSCIDVMQYARPEDYQKFCTCTANQVAENYTARPNMNMRYISQLRSKAFTSCGIAQNATTNSPYLENR